MLASLHQPPESAVDAETRFDEEVNRVVGYRAFVRKARTDDGPIWPPCLDAIR
jgi:hypothetical protein